MTHIGTALTVPLAALIVMATSVPSPAESTLRWSDFEFSGRADAPAVSAPTISIASDSTYVVAWLHSTGTSTSDIHARRFASDGSPLSEEMLINERGSAYHIDSYSMAMNDEGVFAFVWIQSTDRSVRVRRYNADGTPYDELSALTVEPGTTTEKHNPDISVADDGMVYVTWQTWQGTMGTAVAEAAAIPAQPSPTPKIVTLDEAIRKNPRIAGGNNGLCAVVGSGGAATTSAMLLSFSGPAEVVVPPFELLEDWSYECHDVAMRPDGEWIAAYTRYADGTADVVLQRFTHEGTAIGESVYAEQGRNNNQYKIPRVDYGPNGHIAVTWPDPIDSRIFFRSYSATMNPTTAQVVQVNSHLDVDVDQPAADIDANGTAQIVWKDRRQSHSDIYRATIDPHGEPIGPQMHVNALGMPALRPAVALDRSYALGGCVWDAGGDVYVQFIEGIRSFRRGNMVVNTGGDGLRPAIAVRDSTALVVWEDSSDGTGSRIHSRTYSKLLFEGTDRTLSNVGRHCSFPAVAATEGRFLVAWEERAAPTDTAEIRGQWLLSNGTPSGSNITLSTTTGLRSESPAVAANSMGLAAVTWTVNESGFLSGPIPVPVVRNDVYLRLFDSTGTAQSEGIVVNDALRKAASSDVAVYENGMIAVVWLDQRLQNLVNHVYCQLFDNSATPIGDNFRVDPGESSCAQVSCGVSDDGALMVAWQEQTTSHILSRVVYPDGSMSSGTITHDYYLADPNRAYPDVAAGALGGMVAWVGLFDSYPAERMVWGECYSLANPLTVQPQAPITAGRISTSDRGRTGTFSLLGRRVPGHTSEPRNLPAGVYVGPGGNGTVVRVRLP